MVISTVKLYGALWGLTLCGSQPQMAIQGNAVFLHDHVGFIFQPQRGYCLICHMQNYYMIELNESKKY